MTCISPRKRLIGRDAMGAALTGHIDDEKRFHIDFWAEAWQIDELGHVNNAAWLDWIQDASIAHWLNVANEKHHELYITMVVRHEIDYRGNVEEGDRIRAVTWITGKPRHARYTRRTECYNENGRLIVEAMSSYVLIDRISKRLMSVPMELADLFII